MALTPPPALERQLGAAPMQPYVPGGRSPKRVLNAVSPALAASARPAWATREKPNAMRSCLNALTVAVCAAAIPDDATVAILDTALGVTGAAAGATKAEIISLNTVTISERADMAARERGGRIGHVQEVGKESLLMLAIPRIERECLRTADRRLLISLTPHFVHVWRYLDGPKGVKGFKGITGTDTVTDSMGVTGMGCPVMTLAAAIPDGAAEGILDTALGAAVEGVLWLRRRRRALAVAAPSLEPFHP